MIQTTRVSRRGAQTLALAGLVAVALSAPVATAQTASNPCRANPCRSNPCQKNPCQKNPCQKNPCQPVRNPCQANPCAAKARARAIAHVSTLDQLVDEFLATSDATAGRSGAQEPARFPGPADRPDWFQLLVVTRAENPLLEEDCKKQALQLSVERFAGYRGIEDETEALRAAAEHIRTHQDFVHSHGISYSDYLREIAECKAFCAPVVASLIQCQVLSVARNPHGIVLFEMDSDAVDARYEGGSLSNLVTQLDKDAARKVALIGRASRIGDLRYNRRLSARRALAVRDTLIELGVAPERVETMWFGWEPPQLSDWIAGEYGMRDLYAIEGPLRMNQSVIAVVY